MLIGGRAIAGVGASGIIVGGMTIIAGAVSLEKRACKSGPDDHAMCGQEVLTISLSVYGTTHRNRPARPRLRACNRWRLDSICDLAMV